MMNTNRTWGRPNQRSRIFSVRSQSASSHRPRTMSLRQCPPPTCAYQSYSATGEQLWQKRRLPVTNFLGFATHPMTLSANTWSGIFLNALEPPYFISTSACKTKLKSVTILCHGYINCLMKTLTEGRSFPSGSYLIGYGGNQLSPSPM
jgi:hypothetical protein